MDNVLVNSSRAWLDKNSVDTVDDGVELYSVSRRLIRGGKERVVFSELEKMGVGVVKE